MIEVRYIGRLSNNLFQYCLGRILAEGLAFELVADPIPGFKNTFQPVLGAKYLEPTATFGGQTIALDDLLMDNTRRRVVLEGWFQQARYYRPYRDDISRWLQLDSSIEVADIKPDLVVHVRRTDYVQYGWALPFSYYEEAIEHLLPRGGNIWIGTDDPYDPFFRKFRRWRPKFFSGSALEQFVFMRQSPRLVMSQSTYSWWPAFLSRDQHSVCPVPNFGCWAQSGADDIGVRLIEGSCFDTIACNEPYEPTGLELRYQKWRLFKRQTILDMNRKFGLRLKVPAQ